VIICGEITSNTLEQVLKEVNEGSLKEIWLCTQGGDLTAALGIYDLIVDRDIKVIGAGYVQSCGLVILLGGSERVATEHTRFMSHAITIEVEEEDDEIDPADLLDVKEITKVVAELYIRRGNMDAPKALDMLTTTNHFDAKTAVELGFIQSVWRNGDSRGLRQVDIGFRGLEGSKR
jgi:ATP-dependent protease ClpP protease subunit